MSTLYRRLTARLPNEQGQSLILVILALGLFLLGAVGFAIDLSNLWFHRQRAQTAADAACTAGVMDMLYDSEGVGTYSWINSVTDCNGDTTDSPCWYAAQNGYNGAHLPDGSASVALSYPSSVSNVPACSGTPTPATCVASGLAIPAYLTVTVADSVSTPFIALTSLIAGANTSTAGWNTTKSGAKATCGLVYNNAPIPLLILDPTDPSTLALSGTGSGPFKIKIIGGPPRSVQVDTSSTSAITANGHGLVDLSQGGPKDTGSDFGVTGSNSQLSGSNLSLGTSGNWVSPDSPISDPFATLPYPPTPSAAPATTTVSPPTDGCQDPGGCTEYQPGLYPSGIDVKSQSAIFVPGVYYIQNNGFTIDTRSCVRPSTATGDGSGGTMFYFDDTGGTNNTVSVNSNAGTYGVCGGYVSTGQYTVTCSASYPNCEVPLTTVECDGTTTLPANVTAQGGLVGNVLLAPCRAPTAGGTNYGDPLGDSDPIGEQRGILFFQNRSDAGVQPNWGGGGAFGLMGIMYFHSLTDTGSSADFLTLGGNSTSNTFVIGDIVVDKLDLHGTPGIEMDLNPNALYYVLKAALLQ
jgi:hypothetical protein